MPYLFAATLFVSASLLFMVQPMVGKMVLPLLGGSPAVWNACMVFFQALLLLGYQYAHYVAGKYEPRKQWLIHTCALGLPILAFMVAIVLGARHSPIAIAESLAPSGESSPILSVLMLLTVAIGIPFLIVSTSAPLLQKWFAYTGHPSARDPYFLYSASNLGSMISLLGYPLFIEPNLSIIGQAWLFAIGFGVLAVMIYFCGQAAANPIGVPPAQRNNKKDRKPPTPAAPATADSTLPATTEPPPTFMRKLKWIALAFVPSSLMLGVTFFMSTDIASIPLLWVIPLALYLVTFIIAFGRVPDWFRVVIGNLAPVMVLLLIFVLISSVDPGMGIRLMLHVVTFFAVALMCHYELARDRPSPQYLTGFFLLMSVGGVLGGIFNSLVAPLVFVHAYEYPLVLVIACLLVPKLTDDPNAPPRSVKQKRIALALDIIIPVLLGVGFYYLSKLPSTSERFSSVVVSLSEKLSVSADTIVAVLIYAVPVMLCFFFVDRPLRFALCAAAILGPIRVRESTEGIIHAERSFFGILKVEEHGQYNRLVHGTTLHGTQVNENFKLHWADSIQMQVRPTSPWEQIAVIGANLSFNPREEPLTYYHRTGPVGAMVREMRTRKGGADFKADFAMVGLGTGSASCYALPGQRLTFYEIDPAVKHLVFDDDKYFTFVKDAQRRGANVDIRMGDARLKLKEDTDRRYTLLMIDAFSSDAIPVHLITREAIELYMNRITDDGILALHISNKYIDLEPVAAQHAKDMGLAARVWNDSGERGRPGKTASSWVVIAKDLKTLGTLGLPEEEQKQYGTDFRELKTLKDFPAWTDDYSDVMRVMMLSEVQKLRRFFGLPTLKSDE